MSQSVFILELKTPARATPEVFGYFLSLEAAREATETLLKRGGRGTQGLENRLTIYEIPLGLINSNDCGEIKEWPLKPELVHECPCGEAQCYVDDEGTSGCEYAASVIVPPVKEDTM